MECAQSSQRNLRMQDGIERIRFRKKTYAFEIKEFSSFIIRIFRLNEGGISAAALLIFPSTCPPSRSQTEFGNERGSRNVTDRLPNKAEKNLIFIF